jgi:CheY-like chemotaxis protein
MQALSALLLSNDTAVLRVSNRILDDYHFSVKAVSSAPAAADLIGCSRFDLAVYDQDTPGAIELASRTAVGAPGVVFATIGDSKTAATTGKRIHVTLQKPLTADLFARSLKAAYGLMIKEKRAAFRHPVRIHPSVSNLILEGEKRGLENAVILNVSQTGLCLSVPGLLLPQDATLQIAFALPASNELIHVVAKVVWSHISGRAGVKFVLIPPKQERTFLSWLDSMLPPTLKPCNQEQNEISHPSALVN